MTRLVINVDDFGITKGVNEAVFKLNELGIVKSTTCLVNSPYFASGAKEAQKYGSLRLGIHLCLDIYDSLSGDEQLCDVDNQFYKAKTHDLKREIDPAIIYQEWKMQIEKFISITGKIPSHIDSHHHAHILNKSAVMAVRKLAEEYNIPVRDMNINDLNAGMYPNFYDQNVSLETLEDTLKMAINTEYDLIDVMCHPAYKDAEIAKISSYNDMREKEFKLLASDEFKQIVEKYQVKLGSY